MNGIDDTILCSGSSHKLQLDLNLVLGNLTINLSINL